MALATPITWSLVIEADWLLAQLARWVSGSPTNLNDSSTAPAKAAVDLEDIRRSCQGDSDAYRRLIQRYQQHVARIMWRFSRDRLVHGELVQEVFVEAYLSLDSYRAKSPFVHWLSRIATRVGYHYWKQNARHRITERLSLKQWDRVPEETGEQMDPTQAAALLHRLLRQLPPRDRLVLTLRYLEECDVAETARRTGWTKTMVKVQTSRARKKLAKLLDESAKELIS